MDVFASLTNMQLQSGNYVRNMFSLFCQYRTKGPIDLDITLVNSIHVIYSSFVRLLILDEIKAIIVETKE